MRSLTVDECSVVSGGLLQKPFGDVGAFDDGLSSGSILGPLAYLLEKQSGSGSDGGGAGVFVTTDANGVETVVISVQRDYCGSGWADVPDSPGGFGFREMCKMHDFLYKIFADQGAFGKAFADAIFLSMMHDACKKNHSGSAECRAWAVTYFAGVSAFGWPAFWRSGG